MKRLFLAWAAVFFACLPATAQHGTPAQPDALVRNLYHEVVARHPHDIPKGADWKVFVPYLSKGLLRRIDLARACSADRDRKSPAPELTARIVSGHGLFSGEEAEPQVFQIEKTEPEKDGSWRVYVSLTWERPPQRSWTWRVAAVVIKESSHFVLDEVIYLDDHIYDREEDRRDKRLSDYLSARCNGRSLGGGDALPSQPEALVRSLYAQVVARRPVGVPVGEDWKVFSPYLSKSLLHRIDLALACGDDWDRQYPDSNLKPEIAWLELGLFSGGDDEIELRTFDIERTQSEKDSSFRVSVRLTWGPPEDRWISHVAAIVVRDNGHPVVNDVIYLKETGQDVESRLTQSLSTGCDGPRWVGYHDSK